MRTTSSVTVPAPADRVLPFLVDLSRYPQWMPLVHSAGAEEGAVPAAWNVELRARVGPFARSKRLRMVLAADTSTAGTRVLQFERREANGALHSAWNMTVTVDEGPGATTVTIDLEYGGSLWTAGVLDRVLAAQIEAGKAGLTRAVSAG